MTSEDVKENNVGEIEVGGQVVVEINVDGVGCVDVN